MTTSRTGYYLVFLLLSANVFLAMTSGLMLSPLLVGLAREFGTSVAVSGQLAAATFVTWAITAPLAGALSDIYGRRSVVLVGLALMGVGVLGSALAWSYSALLAFRLLTGIGAAVLPANTVAAVADFYPAQHRGKLIGWLASSGWLGALLGLPVVALLADAGGWRLPFYAVGVAIVLVWGMLWVWFPRGIRSGRRFSLVSHIFSHFKEVGHGDTSWYVLATNVLAQTALFGVFTYLAAYLIQTYQIREVATALPLALAGAGTVVGSLAGGNVAGRTRRLGIVAISLAVGGLLTGAVFGASIPLWAVVALSFVALGIFTMTFTVFIALMVELAGGSRGTAMGLVGASNQIGGVFGASVGGLLLSLGGFPLVGLLCLAAAVVAAVVVRVKVSPSPRVSMRPATGLSNQGG